MLVFYQSMGIYALGLAVFLGAVARLAVHLLGLGKRLAWPKLRLGSTEMKQMGLLTAPIALGVIFSQASTLVDNAFASMLADGTVSALTYAKKLIDLPVVVLPYALGIVVFPYFSQLKLEKRLHELLGLFSDALYWIVLVFVPLSLFMLWNATPIVQLALERGAFDANSTSLTAPALSIYAIGLTAFAVETVLVLLYYAMGDTRRPIGIGILMVLINFALTWALLSSLGHLGIALALVVSKTLKVIVLLWMLKGKFTINFGPGLRIFSKILLAALPVAALLFVADAYVAAGLPDGKLMDAAYLGGLFTGTGIVFLLMVKVLGLPLKVRNFSAGEGKEVENG